MSYKYQFICKYCNHSWNDSFYYEGLKLTCTVCGEKKNFTVKSAKVTDVFGYGNEIKEDAYIKVNDE